MATTGSITPPLGNVGEQTGFTQGVGKNSAGDGKADKDMFLKLLVAQLKYQDPTKPADTSQMLSQTAQFTMVEKMDQLLDAYTNEMQASELTSATSMLGNTITWTSKDSTKTGVVTGVSITNGMPTLMVGGVEVAISDVTNVSKGAAAPTTSNPSTTAPGATTPGTTAPGTTNPGTTAPGTTAPGTTNPGTTTPGTAPSTGNSGTGAGTGSGAGSGAGSGTGTGTGTTSPGATSTTPSVGGMYTMPTGSTPGV